MHPNGILIVKKTQHPELRHLGVRGSLSQALSLPSGVTLDAGTNVIIQQLQPAGNGLPSFNLTVYRYITDNTDDAELPERLHAIVPEKISHIAQVDPLQYFIFDERTEISHEPLFPTHRSPCIDEIAQGTIPDCAFLSGLQAILNHPDGADFIRGMMKRNVDGTVTVRLFQNGLPTYVKVQANILQNQSGSLSRHLGLWVHILENAVAALGTKDSPWGRTTFVGQSISTVYNDGISFDYVMKVLTGLKCSFYILCTPDAPLLSLPRWLLSTATKDVYHIINHSLEAGHLVMCSSLKPIKPESRISEFPYRHAFTVLRAHSKETGTETIEYLTLRNPWGNTGLSYHPSEGRLYVDQSKAEFDIKLTDFDQHFGRVVISEFANDLFIFEKRCSDLSAQILDTITEIKTETSLAELIAFKHKYELYKELLIELAILHIQRKAPDLLKLEPDPNISIDDLINFPGLAAETSSSSTYHSLRFNREELELNLLQRLFWMKTQRNPDVHALHALESFIVTHADYDFCDIMNNEKMKFDILVQAYAHRYAAKIESLSQKAANLQTQLTDGTASNTTFFAFTQLRQEEIAASSLAASLSALNIPIDLQALTRAQNQLNEIEARFNTVAYQQYTTLHQVTIASLLDSATLTTTARVPANADAILTHIPDQPQELQQLENAINDEDNWQFYLLFYTSVPITLIGCVLIALNFYLAASLPLIVGGSLVATGVIAGGTGLSKLGFFSAPKNRFSWGGPTDEILAGAVSSQ